MAQASSDEELLRDLCSSNGLDYEQVVSSGGSKKTKMLEMFFFGVPRLPSLHLFPSLKVLRLVNQNIPGIQGLADCPCLEELWLCECKILRIEGLEKCGRLRKLMLYQNCISKIEGLEELQLLSVLWLNSNKIHTIEGLEHLENLQDLNLADNAIQVIGPGLGHLEHLKVLNLSTNSIRRLEDLCPVFDLCSLEELSLSDPMHGPNPVSTLCNYSTHVLYHLPGLRRLDSREVTHPYLANIVKLVVHRKKQFYGMRAVHLDQVCWARTAQLRSGTAADLAPLHGRLRALRLGEKEQEQEGGGSGSGSLDGIRTRIGILEAKCQRLRRECAGRCRAEEQQTLLRQRWLGSELRTGGNVRYQQAGPGEEPPWLGPCRDIVTEMMDSDQLKQQLGVLSCDLGGVVQVDNRGCRLAVQRAVRAFVLAPGLPEGSRELDHLTYLLLVPGPRGISLEAVVEQGEFSTSQDGRVALTGKVSCAVEDLLLKGKGREQKEEQKEGEEEGSEDGVDSFSLTSLVLCQVFIPPTPDSSASSLSPPSPGRSGAARADVVMVPSRYVQPEYIVNLRFTSSSSTSQSVAEVPEDDSDVLKASKVAARAEIVELSAEALEPRLPQQQQPQQQQPQQQQDEGGSRPLEELVLFGCGLRRVQPSCHAPLCGIRILDLSHNRLTTTAHIDSMPNLVRLDLSYNSISAVEGMKGLLKLQAVDLSWNCLSNLAECVGVLRKATPSLSRLDLRGHSWGEGGGGGAALRLVLVGHLKLLQWLDGRRVEPAEAEAALRGVVSSHLSLASVASRVRVSPQPPQTLSLQPTAEYLYSKTSLRPSQLTSQQSDWWKEVTSVCANDLGLVQVKAIGRCGALRWASFTGNHLQHLDGLEECGQLEQLCADRNWLRKIDSACSLKSIVHLSLSRNLLPSLAPLGRSALPALKSLDVSGNLLASLAGVEGCAALVELYAGNNRLRSARDILPVKKLQHITILDLYGNPMEPGGRSLRLYAAYHVSSLKAFNGSTLESKECAAAREMYGGRLNVEFVQDRLGHGRFAEVRQLDFPGCGLRLAELHPLHQFSALLSLNLEQNQLTSFSGLLYLPNLKVLCLNHNKIDRLFPADDPSSPAATASSPALAGRGGVGGGGGVVLPSLQVLHLAYNQLPSLLPLQLHKMPSLRALFLQGNQLVSLDGLHGLNRLTELVLDHNKIRVIGEQCFSSLADLRVLHIEENRLREVSNFAWLVNLEKLFLGMNRIQEFSDLDGLCSLLRMNELSLLSNPVSRRLHFRTQVLCRLPHLCTLDGVVVSEDEQMRVKAILHEQEAPDGYGVVQTPSGQFLVTNMTALPHEGVSRNTLPAHPHNSDAHYRK